MAAPKTQTCSEEGCSQQATKKVIWAEGMAYQPSCDKHVEAVKSRIKRKNGAYGDIDGVRDFSVVVDLVSSRVYPDLERKAGGPDNWVEQVGGLPSYIERIAKHLHYEQGYSISRAIATAVNTVKRWARGGAVAVGRPERVTPATAAKAAKALAEWEAKKASARAMPGTPRGGGGGRRRDLATPTGQQVTIDLARTKDGRKSYRNQGKWGHGFVPLDEAAKKAKAKGSPIAMKRMNRLYGGKKAKAPQKITEGKGGGSERVNDIAQLRHLKPSPTKAGQRQKPGSVANKRKVSQRATKAWTEIPESQKMIRNGKRYTLTTFRGKTQLTEWVGPNYNRQQTGDIGSRLLKSVTTAQLQQMTTAELRRLLRVKGQPQAVKKAIHAMIKVKMEKRKQRA